MSNAEIFKTYSTYGLIWFAIGLVVFWFYRRKYAEWIVVVGRVEELVRRKKNPSTDHPGLFPKVSFYVDSADYHIVGKSSVGEQYEIGQPVEVLVNPADPESAIIRRPMELYIGAVVCAVFGCLCFIVAIVARLGIVKP